MRPVLRRGLTADATRSTRKPPLAESPLPQPRGKRPPPPGVRLGGGCGGRGPAIHRRGLRSRRSAATDLPRDSVREELKKQHEQRTANRLRTRGAAPAPRRLWVPSRGSHSGAARGGWSLPITCRSRCLVKKTAAHENRKSDLAARETCGANPGAAQRGRPLKRLRLTSQSNAGCRDLHALCVRIVGGWNTGRSRVVFLPSTWVAFRPLGAEEGHPASK